MSTGAEDRYAELRGLVIEAFERAHQKGNASWEVMTLAVLKNRLLDITDRNFREADFGAPKLPDLVANLDVVALEETGPGGSVRLLSPYREEIAAKAPLGLSRRGNSSGRIRGDLWKAVLDYSNAEAWRWNKDLGIAEPVAEGEKQYGDLILPTISPDQLKDWRRAFIDSKDEQNTSTIIAAWVDSDLSSDVLPRPLRGQWFEFLKERILQELTVWFSEISIQLPVDLIADRQHPRSHDQSPDDLRGWVISCIESMSREELLMVQVPLAAIHRIKNRE